MRSWSHLAANSHLATPSAYKKSRLWQKYFLKKKSSVRKETRKIFVEKQRKKVVKVDRKNFHRKKFLRKRDRQYRRKGGLGAAPPVIRSDGAVAPPRRNRPYREKAPQGHFSALTARVAACLCGTLGGHRQRRSIPALERGRRTSGERLTRERTEDGGRPESV